MKNQILLLTLGLSALVLAGCSKSERAEAKADIKEAYKDTKAVVADAWSDLKDFTFEKRSDFATRTKAMTAKLDAEVSEMQANYAADKASASRRAAMEELKSSRADLGDKLDAIGNATADTWASAKASVIAAWDRTEAAYKKAKVDS
jgi:hypothetical protein